VQRFAFHPLRAAPGARGGERRKERGERRKEKGERRPLHPPTQTFAPDL
jgi:hypothetical protein